MYVRAGGVTRQPKITNKNDSVRQHFSATLHVFVGNRQIYYFIVERRPVFFHRSPAGIFFILLCYFVVGLSLSLEM